MRVGLFASSVLMKTSVGPSSLPNYLDLLSWIIAVSFVVFCLLNAQALRWGAWRHAVPPVQVGRESRA